MSFSEESLYDRPPKPRGIECIRYSRDGKIARVWDERGPVREADGHDKGDLPVGPDMTAEDMRRSWVDW